MFEPVQVAPGQKRLTPQQIDGLVIQARIWLRQHLPKVEFPEGHPGCTFQLSGAPFSASIENVTGLGADQAPAQS